MPGHGLDAEICLLGVLRPRTERRIWVARPTGDRDDQPMLLRSSSAVIRHYWSLLQCGNTSTPRFICSAHTLIASWGSDPTEELAAVAKAGWEMSQFGPPLEINRAACRMDIGAYAIFGDFDDRERGAAFIARPLWIETMFAQRGWQTQR